MYIDTNKLCSGLVYSNDYECISISDYIVDKLINYFSKNSFNMVIGLSGGIDSALVFHLAHMAQKKLHNKLYTYFLPYNKLHDESQKIIQELDDKYNQKTKIISIESIVAGMCLTVSTNSQCLTPFLLGNICARARMMVLMHESTVNSALLLGTENKTEHALGYFTIGGDNVSNIEPIHDLYKTQVFQIAKSLDLPNSVLDRAPSAELWAGQTDVDELGATYEQIDNTLYQLENYGSKFVIHSPSFERIQQRYLSLGKAKRSCPIYINL